MMHHPGEDLLVSYAGGSADEARALIVATHLSFCAQCRDTVALMERMGGALLEGTAPVPLAGNALARALTRLDGIEPFERPRRAQSRAGAEVRFAASAYERATHNDGTPAVLRSYLGGDLAQVRWRAMGPNLSYVPLFRRGDVKVRLLRGVPGANSGRHSHRGLEYTVVIKGGYTDISGAYGPGDVQVADADVVHNPIADPGEDCINLAVTTAPLRFEGLLQKIAGPLFGF